MTPDTRTEADKKAMEIAGSFVVGPDRHALASAIASALLAAGRAAEGPTLRMVASEAHQVALNVVDLLRNQPHPFPDPRWFVIEARSKTILRLLEDPAPPQPRPTEERK